MAYTLYLDRPEEFICEVAVKNASLKDAFARMVVEANDLTLMFEGKLKDGKCIVPIRRLKGLIDENSKGKMHLEVIVEDTYFKPWSDNFIVEEHTSIKVKVNEQKKPSKPIVEVRTLSDIKTKISVPAQDLVYIFEKVGINKKNFNQKGSDFKQVIKEYFKASPEFIKESKKYIQEAVTALK
jgi:hypothetical protein